MEYVLTTASKVSCDHPPIIGGGPVTLKKTQSVLKIKGKSVLVGDLKDSDIDKNTCLQQITNATPNNNPCSTVKSQSIGQSNVLKVNGSPVLLMTSSGITDGLPLNTWSAKDSAQTVLRAD